MYLLVYTKNNGNDRNWYYFQDRETLEKFIADEDIKNTLTDSFEVTYDRGTCARLLAVNDTLNKKINDLWNRFNELTDYIKHQNFIDNKRGGL